MNVTDAIASILSLNVFYRNFSLCICLCKFFIVATIIKSDVMSLHHPKGVCGLGSSGDGSQWFVYFTAGDPLLYRDRQREKNVA